MKIEKFNESTINKNSYYKLYVFINGNIIPVETGNFDTIEAVINKLKVFVNDGILGTDGNTYHIYDAYIEKITRVKSDEIAALINTKKYNL